MKHLFPKLLFIVFLILGISSFVFLKKNNTKTGKEEVKTVRVATELDNGFTEREPMF